MIPAPGVTLITAPPAPQYWILRIWHFFFIRQFYKLNFSFLGVDVDEDGEPTFDRELFNSLRDVKPLGKEH